MILWEMSLGVILSNLKEELNLTSLSHEDRNSLEVTGCYIGDLLSNVMSHGQAGELWLTVQNHQNVIAVASLLNLAGVVFLEGHYPPDDTIERAKREGIPLFICQEGAFALAIRLYQMGLKGRGL